MIICLPCFITILYFVSPIDLNIIVGELTTVATTIATTTPPSTPGSLSNFTMLSLTIRMSVYYGPTNHHFFQLIIGCFENGIAYPGNDLNGQDAKGQGKRDSPEECQQLCQETPGCNAFTYRPVGCWMKSTKAPGIKSSDAVSGDKYCNGKFCYVCNQIFIMN